MTAEQFTRYRAALRHRRNRPRVYPLVTVACEGCGVVFEKSTAPSERSRRYCSQRCGVVHSSKTPEVRVRQGESLRARMLIDTDLRQSKVEAMWAHQPDRRGVPLSVQHRRNISIGQKGHVDSDETKQKKRKNAAGGRPEQRAHRRALWADPEWRDKMVQTHREGFRNGSRQANYAKRVPHLDAHGRLWTFRSTWELKFAQYLDAHELSWDYEPHRLLLSDGRVYIPDFWIHEWSTYVEIKGYWKKGMKKVSLAHQEGHHVITIGDITQGDAALHAALTQAGVLAVLPTQSTVANADARRAIDDVTRSDGDLARHGLGEE